MGINEQRMAALFNEWAKRYQEDPDGFISALAMDAEEPDSYGDACVKYLGELEEEMDRDGLLPNKENL